MNTESRRQRLIELVDTFPETVREVGGEEDQHIGFSVRKRRFAWYLDDHHGDGMVALTCKAPPGVNDELVDLHLERFFIPEYTGPRGWVGLRVDLESVDWVEIEELLDDAYRMAAPKKLIARLDSDD